MKRIFSLLVAVLMVAGMLVLVPSAEDDELPEDAIILDYAGYIHDAYFVILAGDDMTVAELTALGIGESKDMNYFAVAVVDGYDRIVELHLTLGRPAGVKSDVVCPAGGYIIGLNGNKAGYEAFASAQVGDEIDLYNIDVEEFRGVEGQTKLENAGFVIHSKSGAESELWLNMPITEENGVAIDEGDVDGQLYVYPAGAEDRVLESSEGNLRYSYIVVCDKDGKAIEAGNNLVFASVDTSFQNEITIPAGGFAFTFYYNGDNTANQELYDLYLELILGAQIFNATTPVDLPAYTFKYAEGWLEVYKTEEEAPESSEEESSEEPAESSEEAPSEEPAESSEEQQTSAPAPSTSAPQTSTPAPAEDGAPIGIIIGVIAGVAVIAVIVVVIIRKRK